MLGKALKYKASFIAGSVKQFAYLVIIATIGIEVVYYQGVEALPTPLTPTFTFKYSSGSSK